MPDYVGVQKTLPRVINRRRRRVKAMRTMVVNWSMRCPWFISHFMWIIRRAALSACCAYDFFVSLCSLRMWIMHISLWDEKWEDWLNCNHTTLRAAGCRRPIKKAFHVFRYMFPRKDGIFSTQCKAEVVMYPPFNGGSCSAVVYMRNPHTSMYYFNTSPPRLSWD